MARLLRWILAATAAAACVLTFVWPFENVWRVVHYRYTHGLAFVALTGLVAWLLATDGVVLGAIAVLAPLRFKPSG